MTDCPPRDVLDDYFAGVLGRDDAARIEDHVFECERCAPGYEAAGAMPAALRDQVMPVLGPARVAALEASGVRMTHAEIDSGVPAIVEFTQGVAMLVFRLRGDFTGARRVDLEIADAGGAFTRHIEGAPWDPERGEVLMLCQRHYMQGQPRVVLNIRVFAEGEGARRTVGEYVVDHRVLG